MATPLLQNMGDQPVYVSELSGLTLLRISIKTVSLISCLSRTRFMESFRVDGSLAPFVAQRALGSNIELSSAFLEIPKTYLDGVLAVGSTPAGLTYWFDSYLDYKGVYASC